jgi:DNA-binding GntR family transcriptional regulator
MDPKAERVFESVQTEPLSGIILNAIREAIVECRLRPGEIINQVEISRQFGVSRAPVREALRQLERDGLVTNVPYRGTVVTPLTAESVDELQSLRRLFETFAVERIIENQMPIDFPELEALLDEIRSAASAGNLAAMNAADIEFHTALIRMSGHRLVLETWQRYVSLIRRTLAIRNRENPDVESIVALHEDLLAAFKSRDLARIYDCYSRHGANMVASLQPYFEEEVDKSETESVLTRSAH